MSAEIMNFLNVNSVDKCLAFTDLPDWAVWDNVAKRLPDLLQDGKLRGLISTLPSVNIADLKGNLGLIKRAYTIFTFISHGYIRGHSDDPVLKELPEKLSSVWMDSGMVLGVPPVATYAATVLFNIREQINEGKAPEDLEMEFTFTGSADEKWFYAISAAIDAHSGEISMIAKGLLNESNYSSMNNLALELSKKIRELTSVLNRMYERCRPEVFSGHVRPYLNGWLNDSEFPEGLCYKLSDGRCEYLKLAGGSAAQNPTVQLLDVILDVKHGADEDSLMLPGYRATCQGRMNYLSAMRTYMPREHCDYLYALEQEFKPVHSLLKQTENYKLCVEALKDFRTEHIKMVTRYIICGSMRGTGGSNPIPFLKKCRRETEEAAAEEQL